MVLNQPSCIYECSVSHSRLEPKKNSFRYKLFTFFFDLDELNLLDRKLTFFSHNKWNLFSIYDKDHFNIGKGSIKDNILNYLKEQKLDMEISKIYLITNIRILGYVFNPVCFYYCCNKEGEVNAIVVEVHNTFGELKPFLLTKEDLNENEIFVKKYTKFFYVSPFQDLETEFEFRIGIPGEKFRIDIDDYKENNKIFLSNYKGKREQLSSKKLFFYFFKYPLVTIKVISLIHWQALKLLLMKIPYFKKMEFPELQKGVYNGKNTN
ncbi:MAG: DUF1365 domain-containing protein [Leptospiraceae bacterium]|nr:DUF1365 domain-containing protein [Leptospiraceae bacterium]